MSKIRVGVLGATGMVGQNFIRLLRNHPWFEVSYVAASPRSAGKTYADAVAGRWHMDQEIPEDVKPLIVMNASNVGDAKPHCELVFSAVDLDKQAIRDLESAYAAAGFPVVSNNSAHRWTDDVPMIVPEVNPGHVEIIAHQRQHYGWTKGLIAVKPNCSLQSYMTPVYALIEAGYAVESLVITTLQAVSGAGYPGVSSWDMIDNIVPYIGGEDEKSEQEPLKILGTIQDGKILSTDGIKISAQCNRVPVLDGHTASVSVKFKDAKPSKEHMIEIWRSFVGEPQKLELPTAPNPALIYRDEPNRPQPRKDRDAGNGMAITMGGLRECPVLDYRFVALSHNTIRGAAGGAILGAELIKAKGYLD